MRGLSKKLTIAVLAGLLGACSHGVKKADISSSAAPADEVARMESDISTGFENQYDVLAPKEFNKAQAQLKEAKDDMRKGQKQEEILTDIAWARGYYEKAKDLSEQRAKNVQGILDARQTAIKAGAKNFPSQRERIAEIDDEFRRVSDDTHVSTDKFNHIQNAYFDLELGAIQAGQLDNAKAKLAGARRNGAETNTPKSLKQAELDLTNAYNVISANRHNPEGFQSAVDKANQSAQFLVDVLAETKRGGGNRVSEEVATQIVLQNRQLASVKGQLGEAQQQQAQMNQTLNEQQQQLSEAETAQKLEAALESARKEFGKNEADVYRQGDKLLIRLKSMNFRSGRSDLPKDSLDVLAKVKGVAETLNPDQVVIQGHTDSTGNAQKNLELSQERAHAVAEYLQTTGLEGDKIQAVGQGYKEPIASNKTKAGRAQNRRVDVIITPSHTLKSGQQQPQSM